MRTFKKAFLGFVGALALSVAGIASPPTALAQIGGGGGTSCSTNSDCPSNYCYNGLCATCLYNSNTGETQCVEHCTTDSDCPPGKYCNSYGACLIQESVCDHSSPELIMVAPTSWGLQVGDTVHPFMNNRNNTNYLGNCNNDSECDTPYSSQVRLNAACGVGYACTIYDDPNSHGQEYHIRHSGYIGDGKYEIEAIIGSCSDTNYKFYRIKPCNC